MALSPVPSFHAGLLSFLLHWLCSEGAEGKVAIGKPHLMVNGVSSI